MLRLGMKLIFFHRLFYIQITSMIKSTNNILQSDTYEFIALYSDQIVQPFMKKTVFKRKAIEYIFEMINKMNTGTI